MTVKHIEAEIAELSAGLDATELRAHQLRAQARGLEAEANNLDVQLTAFSTARNVLQQLKAKIDADAQAAAEAEKENTNA